MVEYHDVSTINRMKILRIIFLWIILAGWLLPLSWAVEELFNTIQFIENAHKNDYGIAQWKDKEYILGRKRGVSLFYIARIWCALSILTSISLVVFKAKSNNQKSSA